MTCRPSHPRPGLAVHRVAGVQLRGRAGPLPARAYWPALSDPGVLPALLVFFPGGGSIAGGLQGADALCRGLCSHVGVVVLSVSFRSATQGLQHEALQDATTATDWAADHAAELGADPRWLLVAGEAVGGNLAAAVALHARDHGWPAIARQVLICPHLAAGPSESSTGAGDPHTWPVQAPSVVGVAAATVVTVDHGPAGDDGRWYAARLRNAGVDVDELRYDDRPHLSPVGGGGSADRMLGDLARSLRRTLGAPPARPGPHRGARR